MSEHVEVRLERPEFWVQEAVSHSKWPRAGYNREETKVRMSLTLGRMRGGAWCGGVLLHSVGLCELPAWADCRYGIGKCLSRCLEQPYRQLWVGSGRAGLEAHISRGDIGLLLAL